MAKTAAPRLRSRFDEHLSRKIFHIAVGTVTAYFFASNLDRLSAIKIYLLIAGPWILLEGLRLKIPLLSQLWIKYGGSLMREEERHGVTASLYYALGLGFALIFLPKVIAIQAILTLAWMDPIAGIFGSKFGKKTWNSVFKKFFVDLRGLHLDLGAKTVEGSFAGFLAAVIAGLIAWTGPWASYPVNEILWWPATWQVVLLSVGGAAVGMVAEAWPSQWDDNANIPFWTGVAVWAMTLVMGVPLRF